MFHLQVYLGVMNKMSHGTVHCTANVQRGTTRLNTLSSSIPTELQGHIAINVQIGHNELGHTFWFCSYWNIQNSHRRVIYVSVACMLFSINVPNQNLTGRNVGITVEHRAIVFGIHLLCTNMHREEHDHRVTKSD